SQHQRDSYATRTRVTLSQCRRVRFRQIGFVDRPRLERFKRVSGIDMDHGVKLFCQTSVKVMAGALSFRTIDDADCPFEQPCPEHLGNAWIMERQQELVDPHIVE